MSLMFFLADISIDIMPERPRNEYLKIDYSSSYEPAPDIDFENEFSKLGLITDVVKGLANQGKKRNF